MELRQIEKINSELCALSIDLARQALVMPKSDPDYLCLSTLAERVDSAATWAYLLYKNVSGRETAH